MSRIALITSFFLVLLLAGAAAMAQFSILPLPLSLNAHPQSPNAGEEVIITASTPTFDKNAAIFKWVVDGKERPDLSGLGKNSIRLIAGAVGSVTRVSVDALKSGGESAEASLGIISSDLVVTWFAETHIPKWYKGKALPAQGSVVNFVAVPKVVLGGSTIPPSTLSYTWGLDDNDFELSGTGEQIFRVRLSDLPKQTHDIRLTVEDVNKRIKKEKRIFMDARDPMVSIYKISPLGGVEPRSALTPLTTAQKGTLDFIAEPFFFPLSSKKSLSYNWNANGVASAGSPSNPNILTLNTNENTGNQILISLSVNGGGPYISAAIKAVSLFLR